MPRTVTGSSRHFSVVLYPDSLEHMDMLRYLQQHSSQFQIVYILHDKDIFFQDDIDLLVQKKEKGKYTGDIPNVGDPKKPHYHLYIYSKNSYTLSAFLKFFAVWIDYAEVVTSSPSYIMYMLHDTPDSLHKHQYDASLLQGDPNLIRKYIHSSNFVQLSELVNILIDNGGRMSSLLKNISQNERQDLLDVIKQYQSLLCTSSNQEFRLFMDNLEKKYR